MEKKNERIYVLQITPMGEKDTGIIEYYSEFGKSQKAFISSGFEQIKDLLAKSPFLLIDYDVKKKVHDYEMAEWTIHNVKVGKMLAADFWESDSVNSKNPGNEESKDTKKQSDLRKVDDKENPKTEQSIKDLQMPKFGASSKKEVDNKMSSQNASNSTATNGEKKDDLCKNTRDNAETMKSKESGDELNKKYMNEEFLKKEERDVFTQIKDLSVRSKVISAYEKLSPEKLKDIRNYRTGNITKTEDKVYYIGIYELMAKYYLNRNFYPSNAQKAIENVLLAYTAHSGGSRYSTSTDMKTDEKVLYYLINYPWTSEKPVIDVAEIRKAVREKFVGQDNVVEQLIRIVYAMQFMDLKHSGFILLTGPSGSGKSFLIDLIAKTIDPNYSTIHMNYTGDRNDVDALLGSARIYENGKPGKLLRSVFETRSKVLVFEGVDKADGKILSSLLDLDSDNLVDNFVECATPYDVLKIAIANSVSNIESQALLDRSIIINMEDYNEKEMVDIVQQQIIPEFNKQYDLAISMDTEYAGKYVHKFKSIRTIKNAISQVMTNLCYECKCEKKVESDFVLNENNISRFEAKNICEEEKGHYVTTYAEIKVKVDACRELYNPKVLKRIDELLDEMSCIDNEENREQKAYALDALKKLANTVNTNQNNWDTKKVKKHLEESHYGMEKVKAEILRYISQCEITENRGKCMLLVSKVPGIGKTSYPESVAKALEIPFIKVSLNQVSDKRFIVGSHRVYRGAKPGIIMEEATKSNVQSMKGVLLLDEVDKMFQDGKGSSEGVLYNLLDENRSYYDEYLQCEIDLSNFLIFLSGNEISRIPRPILDRCNVIHLDGYTQDEQKLICADYLVPKNLKRLSLQDKLEVSKPAVDLLVEKYSMPLGCREIDRNLETVLVDAYEIWKNLNKKTPDKKVKSLKKDEMSKGDKATEKKETSKYIITEEDIVKSLGKKVDKKIKPLKAGEANILAVCGAAGTVLKVQVDENILSNKQIEISGMAKQSVAESVKLAMVLAKTVLKKDLPKLYFHFTDAGTEKEGPSAGVTIFSAIMSYALDTPIPEIAMTGEIDLMGNVLPIGGLTDKLAAARSAGMKKVFVPVNNYAEIAEDIKRYGDLEIIAVSHVDELVKNMFPNFKKDMNK